MKQLKMNRFLVLAILVAILTTASAFAGTVKVTWGAVHGADGVFILKTSGGELGTSQFGSFCIETNESVSIGATYTYTLSDAADYGGANGGHPDPVSIGSAYLYSQFRAGTLEGYTGSVADQNALQTAFWFLEESVMAGGLTLDYKFLDIALDELGLTSYDELLVDADGAYGVGVINLYSNNGRTKNQSMLYIPNVPDGGLTVMLLGLGVGGLALFSRKFRQ